MVSLFEMSLQRPAWSHLSSGIPTLDQMLRIETDAVLDFQSVPANLALSALMCNLVASHLAKSGLRVVIIETLDTFPWDLLRQHPQYCPEWLDRIERHDLSSFAQVYAFFTLMPLEQFASALLVVTSFHELVEWYRLQVSASYEETLLKHEIDNNRIILDNRAKVAEEGLALVTLTQLPPQSSLVKENPIVKAQNHINALFKRMGHFAYKNSAVVILQGQLEPKYKPWPKRNAPEEDSSQAPQPSFPQRNPGRLVLTPVTFGAHNSDLHSPSFCDTQISARLVFYNDWYHKSPHFSRNGRAPEDEDRYMVSAVKLQWLHGVSNINDPVYFDFRRNPGKGDGPWLIDLLEHEQQDLSLFIQNSLSLTQIQPRAVSTQKAPITIPSSPPITLSQQELDEQEVLVISGSDVELTGTLLDDLDGDSLNNWEIRHS